MKNLKIYCDTNVLIDYLSADRPCSGTVRRLFNLLYSIKMQPCVSTQSIVDAAYIMCQSYKCPVELFRESIKKLIPDLSLVYVTKGDILEATGKTDSDFEDMVQIACARRNGCNVIVSSDRKYKRYTDIDVYTPEEFVARVTGAN